MVTLTVFTPTYNRAHTLARTYESLCRQTCKDFEWLIVDDGSSDNTREIVEIWKAESKIPISYIYKENGGLYTGYNTAYANIETELNVCIDSDDYMPDDAVEMIVNTWNQRDKAKEYAGILGLDFNVVDKKPISGYFPSDIKEVFHYELYLSGIHKGDSKQVLRTDLCKQVAPMEGFPGEKNFNPYYMTLQVCDKFPLIVINENLCWVEYQTTGDSMSAAIWKQYRNSARSFAKYRRLEMSVKHNTWKNKFRAAIHYVSSCTLSKDSKWYANSPEKFITILACPWGLLLSGITLWKTRG